MGTSTDRTAFPTSSSSSTSSTSTQPVYLIQDDPTSPVMQTGGGFDADSTLLVSVDGVNADVHSISDNEFASRSNILSDRSRSFPLDCPPDLDVRTNERDKRPTCQVSSDKEVH